MRRTLSLLAAVAVVAGCAPDPPDTYAAPSGPPDTIGALPTTLAPDEATEAVTYPANGVTVDVRSLDNSFIPQTIEIDAGTEINWINGGRNDHNVLPVDESLEWGVDRGTFVPGTEYRHVFEQPGVFPYYCSIHGTKEAGMVGVVIVEAPS